jgi:hypothetical protein
MLTWVWAMKDLDINLHKKKAVSWVKGKRSIEEKMVRLTVDVTPDMHQKLKVKCAVERTTIADMIRGWMEEKLLVKEDTHEPPP